MGITIPIIPAIKPFAKLSQLTMVPKTFHCDIPEELAQEVLKCKTDEDAKALGIEWTTAQVKDLFEHGYNNVHFFTVSAVDSVKQIAKTLFNKISKNAKDVLEHELYSLYKGVKRFLELIEKFKNI